MGPNCGACEAFVSAPIRLAAMITERRREGRKESTRGAGPADTSSRTRAGRPKLGRDSATTRAYLSLCRLLAAGQLVTGALAQVAFLNSQLVNHHESSAGGPTAAAPAASAQLIRHHAHYMNLVPSAHFSYHEGRQSAGRSLGAPANELASEPQEWAGTGPASHIYKRSSALLPASPAAPQRRLAEGSRRANQPLVSSGRVSLNPLSRRMMAPNGQLAEQLDGPLAAAAQQQQRRPNWLGVAAAENQQQLFPAQAAPDSQPPGAEPALQPPGRNGTASQQSEHERELLRQKQHIQYHDQWPSMAGKCHKRTLNFCASVLPFNTTTFPNIIGDTNRFEVKRSLPFFGFLAKSSCNKRLDELLCLLLEPPCNANSGLAIPPCKKFCRLALEGCNEYIPATLALSSVFDCRQYPDSNDPGACVNLAQGSKCGQDEFKCPDKTCIPRE